MFWSIKRFLRIVKLRASGSDKIVIIHPRMRGYQLKAGRLKKNEAMRTLFFLNVVEVKNMGNVRNPT